MHVTQNWPNLEKRPPFLQFSSKLSEFYFGEKCHKSSSFSFDILLKGAYLFGRDETTEKWMLIVLVVFLGTGII